MPDRLLDTSTVSALVRAEPIAVSHLARAPGNDALFLSVVSNGEIRYGIGRLPQGKRRRIIERAYHALLPRFGPWLDVTVTISETYGRIKTVLTGGGVVLPENDLWIAATALVHDLVLVSKDRHFALVPGLTTENWSTP